MTRQLWFEKKQDLKQAEGDNWCTCGGVWGCYDWSKGSKAVVASDGEHALIMEHVGGPLDYWLSEREDSPFDGCAAGLWVWTGNVKGWRDYMGEYDEELEGAFRRLTLEEFDILRSDGFLWDGDEYLLCKDPAVEEALALVK